MHRQKISKKADLKNIKKLIGLIGIFTLLFSLFLYLYLKPTSYNKEYKLKEVKIKEAYNKKEKMYSITINVENSEFVYKTNDKYTNKRGLLSDIKIKIEDGIICIKPESEQLSLYPLCKNDKDFLSYYYDYKDNDNVVIEEYKDISIYDFNNKNYLLWNYKNFIYLNEEKEKDIFLFHQDIYNLELVVPTEKYLLVADYNQKYTFNKFIKINSTTGKKEEIKTKYDIYFDSYYLGTEENNVYLVDRKNKQQYKINLKKDKVTKTEGKILNNNDWEKMPIIKLVNKDYNFIEESDYEYLLVNDYLYLKTFDDKLIKINDFEVNSIVKSDGLNVYYLVKDKLYFFNPYQGNKLLMKYSEWNFNNKNMIFIFD